MTHISFLKIDTEGHEMDVLLGAEKMLATGGVRAIQFEFGETFMQIGNHFKDMFLMLAPRYRIYRILRMGMVELPRYSHDLETYKLANFLCIEKK